MAIVADQVQERAAQSEDEPVDEVLAQLEKEHRPTEHSPAIRQLSNWKTWAIAGAAAVALLAVVSNAVFKNAPDEHQAQVMGFVRSQAEPTSQRIASASNQPQYLPETAEKGIANVQSGSLAADRNTRQVNPQAPMIARTAALTILVKDIATGRSALESILTKHGGYSASLTIDTPESGQRHFQASLRIPANVLTPAIGDLKTLGRALNETQSGEEVTQQHADLVARLQNSRETEQRLRAILQQRTGKIEDVLQVEEEIARVRGEIESMEAEQKVLEHRVSFATIDLQLVEEYKAQFDPSPISASGRMHNAFIEGLRNASGTVLGLILFLEEYGPAILIWTAIFGLPAWVLWRRYRRVRARL